MASEGELSLEEAIRDKYCSEPAADASVFQPAIPIVTKGIREWAVAQRPGCQPIQQRSSIVLDKVGVSHVGEGAELGQLCPQVQEAYLRGNRITDCKHVLDLLVALPRLSLLDLSFNPLLPLTPHTITTSPLSPSLSTLIFNSTNVSWKMVEAILSLLPQLQELQLCKNEYSCVELYHAHNNHTHNALRHLHINENRIGQWSEFEKLGRVFPNLQKLVASGNPLQRISDVGGGDRERVFERLECLNVNRSLVGDWRSIEALDAACGSLTSLSVMEAPLGAGLGEKERRFAVIARLPRLLQLNKSSVNEGEREDAERWLIRDVAATAAGGGGQGGGACDPKTTPPPLPRVYPALVERYGQLDPLVDVDLSPRKTVSLEVSFQGNPSVIRDVDLDQSVSSLRKWVGKQFGRRPSSLRLHYHELERYQGPCELGYSNRKLHSYAMKDGDRLYVDLK